MKNGLYLLLAVAIALLGVVGLTGQGQGASSAGQTLEYKLIVINVFLETWFEDGRSLPGTPNMVSKARELGNQRWELVSGFSFNKDSSSLAYWFKRPK